MKYPSTILITALTCTTLGASAGEFAQALDPIEPTEVVDESSWEFGFRPYLWMTGLEGTIGVNGIEAPVDISFGDIWDNLDFAWSSTFEARKGKWGALLDFTYLDMSDSYTPSFSAPPAPPIAPSGFEVKMFLVDLVGSYRATEWDGGSFDLTGGVRWMSVENTIQLSRVTGGGSSIGGKDDWFDPHIGFRVRQSLNESFYLRGLADVGGFGVGSEITVQALAGAGYRVRDNVSVELAYRYLKEDYDNAPGFTFDTEMAGPVLGLLINW